jgi:Glycosyltransferase family 9 (heptosyltransferase)
MDPRRLSSIILSRGRRSHRPDDARGTGSDLARASLRLAPDTGTVHIAAALGTLVTVYGPTKPGRVGPYGQPDGIVSGGDRYGRIRRTACTDGSAATRKPACERPVLLI